MAHTGARSSGKCSLPGCPGGRGNGIWWTQQSPTSVPRTPGPLPPPLLSASMWTVLGVLFLGLPVVTPWATCSHSDMHFNSLTSDHSILAFHTLVTSLPPATSVLDFFFYSITPPFILFPWLPESLSPFVLLPQLWPILCAISLCLLCLGLLKAAESDHIQSWGLVPSQTH